jgi:hypothetical protein
MQEMQRDAVTSCHISHALYPVRCDQMWSANQKLCCWGTPCMFFLLCNRCHFGRSCGCCHAVSWGPRGLNIRHRTQKQEMSKVKNIQNIQNIQNFKDKPQRSLDKELVLRVRLATFGLWGHQNKEMLRKFRRAAAVHCVARSAMNSQKRLEILGHLTLESLNTWHRC